MFTALRNHFGKFHYLGYGHYRDFLPYISFGDRLPNLADKVALWVQAFLRIAQPPEKFSYFSAVKNLQKELGKGFDAGLFYNQDSHGIASVAGFVKTDELTQFVKVFKNMEDAIFQKFQAEFVATHFNGPFLVMPVTQATSHALIFHFSKRMRDVTRQDYVERKLLHLGKLLLTQSSLNKNVAEILPLGLGGALKNAGMEDLYARIISWRDASTEALEIIPVHGDMRTANLFVNEQEKHVLVNYERAGWHVAYYDFLHYVLEKYVTEQQPPKLDALPIRIEYDRFDEALVLYLIDQLYHVLVSDPLLHIDTAPQIILENLRNWLNDQLDRLTG